MIFSSSTDVANYPFFMTMRQHIGIVGVPPLKIIRQLNEEQAEIIDLDEPQLVLPIDHRDQ